MSNRDFSESQRAPTGLEALNFKSVKRTDPEAARLLCTSSHAVLYIFKDSKWERAEIEGTLLLYQRQDGDAAFVILNRLQANNYRQLFTEIDSFQVDNDLLMYSTHSGPVFGLWIYSEDEREEMVTWFERVMRGREPEMVAVVVPDDEEEKRVAEPRVSRHSSHGASSDIIGMLHRAAAQGQSSPVPPPMPANNNNILQQLFASAQSAPRHQIIPQPPPPQQGFSAAEVGAQLQRMVRFMAAKYPAMGPQQFRNAATELLSSDEILWSELYAAYTKYQQQ